MTSHDIQTDFVTLLQTCAEIAGLFPDGVIFIGGIAVYLHTVNQEATAPLAETTHDADFYISIADMSDLRDIEEVTPNRRLNKHQLIKRGFEFDIYTERHSALLVPYDQIAAYAVPYDGVRVASLEHLLVLKLEAYRDRQSSAKGEKDANDIIRLVLACQARRSKLRLDLIEGYLSDQHLELIERVRRGPQMLALARGNAKTAKQYRAAFEKGTASLLEGA